MDKKCVIHQVLLKTHINQSNRTCLRHKKFFLIGQKEDQSKTSEDKEGRRERKKRIQNKKFTGFGFINKKRSRKVKHIENRVPQKRSTTMN